MGVVGRQLPSERARSVELQLRARSEQLQPRNGRLKSGGAPLGVCRNCGALVYAGDSLAMSGGRLLHGDCT
jgi:hypothetical protein